MPADFPVASWRLVGIAFSVAVGVLTVPMASFAEATRPNIVLILADDVGREVLNCYGGTSYDTKNLDRLADEGARFEHCYSMPVCHPTRICLLTGRYPRAVGNPAWGTFPRELESQTLAHLLRKAGYATAVAGKWQLCLMRDDPMHPKRLGFDEWSLFGWHEGPRYYSPLVYQNGEVRRDTDGKYGPDLYVDFLADFMERNRNRPFFAFYSMTLCHDVTDDLEAPVPYGPRGRYDSYSEMAHQMDAEVGRLIAAVDGLGLREKTLILFTTDNGTAVRSIIRAENGEFVREPVVSRFHGHDVPGGKGKLTDAGTRVPMIASWKGIIEPGQVWDDLVDFSDFLPTFADLSGGRLPEGALLDGQSFADLLMHAQPVDRTWVYAESNSPRFFVKTHRWKLYDDGPFYDTQSDPDETRPLPLDSLPREAKQAHALLEAVVADFERRFGGRTGEHK